MRQASVYEIKDQECSVSLERRTCTRSAHCLECTEGKPVAAKVLSAYTVRHSSTRVLQYVQLY